MGAPTDVELIRQLADVTDDPYDDELIADLIVRTGSDYGAVSIIWKIKAAAYAKKISVSSGSTKIEAGAQFKNALDMAATYEDLAGGLGDDASTLVSVKMAPAYEDDSTEYTWGEGYWPQKGYWAVWERWV